MIALLILLAAAEPAATAQGPVQQLKQKVVEAIRNCPKPKDGDIVVCSRDRGIAEAYRLPRLDPRFAQADRTRSGGGALAQTGARGATPCDRVGAAGAMGCARQDYDAWGDWKRARKEEDSWSR